LEAWALSTAEAVGSSPLGVWMRGSAAGYPVANVAHLLGLVLLLGSALLMDLRLAGLFRSLPADRLARILLRAAICGLTILVASGVAMFASDAAAFARSPLFRWKLALIAMALANIAAFHRLWGSDFKDWDVRAQPAARAMAVVSVLLWLTVATLGRLVAYS
jgi:uncharacterized membrane protein